jgi:hypothetical protein
MRGLVDFLAAECCADEVGCKTTQTAAWFFWLILFDDSRSMGEAE